MQPMNRTYFPVIGLLFGASLWGISWWPFRLLKDQGLEGAWVALVIYAAAFCVGLFWLSKHLHHFKKQPWLMGLLVLSGGWTNVAFVLAMLEGNIMRVLLLFYLSPLWAVLLARIFLKEHMSAVTIATLMVAVIGAAMMIWHPESGFSGPINHVDVLALSSGFAFAIANVVIRKGQEISIQAKALGTWIGVIVIAGAVILLQQTPAPDMSGLAWIGALLFGVIGIVLMTVAVQYGVTKMLVQRSAVILLFELVVGAISQVVLTDETMTLLAWGGGAIIIVAGYLTIRYSEVNN